MHQCFDYKFELVMTLMVKAYATCNRARDLMVLSSTGPEYEENIKQAAALLRSAAGIFEHLTDTELPRWSSVPPTRPLECVRSVTKSLSWYTDFFFVFLKIKIKIKIKMPL